VCSQAHDRKLNDGRVREPKSLEVGAQISRGLHTRAEGKRFMGNYECILGKVFRTLARKAFDAGSCAHNDIDPTQICGVAGGGVYAGPCQRPRSSRFERFTPKAPTLPGDT
jgi:hypothetical protein